MFLFHVVFLLVMSCAASLAIWVRNDEPVRYHTLGRALAGILMERMRYSVSMTQSHGIAELDDFVD